LRLALYQPDIPQNLGAAIRLCACFGLPLDVIEPCGFPLTDRALRRAALDYGALAAVTRHASLDAFLAARAGERLILVETDGAANLFEFPFQASDVLMFGRESAGSPPELRAAADAVVRIPMAAGARSLNVAVSAGIAAAEALRQAGVMTAGRQLS